MPDVSLDEGEGEIVGQEVTVGVADRMDVGEGLSVGVEDRVGVGVGVGDGEGEGV